MKEILENYFDKLWSLNRSITGNGLRQSFKILNELMDLNLYEVPTGTKVFDWEIPKEWNVNEAYIITPDGEKIANFTENNLHLLGYSIPVRLKLNLSELKKHIFSIEYLPDAIPYLTSYYNETWGFCISHNQLISLKDGIYEVIIDSELREGSLTIADAVLKGKSDQEILISTYLCHPSMANNELSGPLVTALLYSKIKAITNRFYTYRFVIVPETIGSIAYLHRNKEYLIQHVYAGFVVTCIGDENKFTYKKSRKGNTITDQITTHILKHYAPQYHTVLDYIPIGSDERQYCSPGFNFPVGSLMRTMYGCYEEYHTSLDNKNFISFEAMEESVNMYYRIMEAFELNHKYINTNPFCEPRLGSRNLYPKIGLKDKKDITLRKILYLLNYSDGEFSLLDIANKFNCSILELKEELKVLLDEGLLIYRT
jgi:aminopeptidase-like protein